MIMGQAIAFSKLCAAERMMKEEQMKLGSVHNELKIIQNDQSKYDDELSKIVSKAWKKLSLKLHPDRLGAAATQADLDRFQVGESKSPCTFSLCPHG
jgi:hypothetical protein